MVSGFVTSPEDQSRICLLEASPIRIASNSLMSINSYRSSLVLDVHIGQLVGERAGLGFCLFLCVLRRSDLHVREIAQLLIGRQGQLTGLVGALLALLGLLGRRLPRGCAQRARREVD